MDDCEDDCDEESDGDRSAYSSIGQKISQQKNDLIVLDYENLSLSGNEQQN